MANSGANCTKVGQMHKLGKNSTKVRQTAQNLGKWRTIGTNGTMAPKNGVNGKNVGKWQLYL